MTELRNYYQRLKDKQRREFRLAVVQKTGKDLRTFYNYLDNEPPKLEKEAIAKLSGIPIEKLYNTI